MASQAPNETVLPRAVLRQSEAIKARFAAKHAGPEVVPPVEAPAPSPTPAAADPATPPAPAPAPAADPRESDPAYWKQRFKVTQGLLDAERGNHVATKKDRDQRIAELETQVATLQASAPRPAADIDLTRFFTPAQIEEYGEEQCRVMASTAQAAAQDQVQALIDARLKPITDARKTESDAATEARKAAFTDALIEHVPNYAEIDVKPEWHAWLAQEDDNSGITRQEILTRHCQRFNASGVAKLFKRYLKETTPPAPPAPPVAPNGTGGIAADLPPAPPAAGGAPSPAEIRDYYKRAGLGKVSDEERVRFEARLKLIAGR